MLTVLLAFVINRLLDDETISSRNRWIALAAAALYGLHPANADTVNYLIASSEVISTLGVIASFALYFAFPRLRRSRLYIVPAAIAILAKPTAAIFAVLFAIYRLLFPDGRIRGRTTGRRALAYFAEIGPPFLICGAMLLLVQHMTPNTWVAGAANARNYIITQPYVVFQYFKTFFWPTGLSADYDLDPFTTTDDPRFWAGFAFSLFFIAIAIGVSVFRKTRVIGFGLLWFLIALMPTSLLPLAEVMNDHRTFLPYIGLVIGMAGVASLLINRAVRFAMPAKIAADMRDRAVPVRKRLRYVPKKQGLENRGNALARRCVKEPAQWTRFDELWQYANGERRLRRSARLLSSRPTAHAAVFRALDQSRDCGRCDEGERGSRATFQGCIAIRAGEPRQLHLLCALPALALARG